MESRILKNNYCGIFVFYVLAIFVINIQNVYGKEPPYLQNVKVQSEVSFNGQSGPYIYRYTITNSDLNTGNIVGFDIDITSPLGGVTLKKDGLLIPYGKWSRTFELSVPKTARVPMIPVGMERPNDWIVLLSVYGTAAWGGGDYVQLKPGQSLSGLGLISYGLPCIRNFNAEPALDADADYYPGIETVKDAEDESAAIIAKIKELYDKVSFKGKTIGPTAPPANFKPVEFLDYIVSLKKDAYYQGWIIQRSEDRDKDQDKDRDKKGKKDEKYKDDDKETGIMNSLDKKLGKARAELVKGDNKEAIEKLKSFTYEVAALYKEGKEIRQSHITSEAFALLYYNAQYLIDQLGGEKKEHHKNHKEKKD